MFLISTTETARSITPILEQVGALTIFVLISTFIKERARNKFGNWRRVYARIQGAETGA